MTERIADALGTGSIILALAFGSVAAYQHDGTLGLTAAVFVAVGYGAYRVAEGERRDRAV